jgi:hypothetical protein
MGLDVDALVAAWKKKSADAEEELQRSTEMRRKRLIERRKERLEVLEGFHRRKFARLADIVSGKAMPAGIIDWLRHDTWTENEGLILLCGFDPENVQFDEIGNASVARCPNGAADSEQRRKSIRRLDGLVLYDPITIQAIGEENVRIESFHFLRCHADLLKVWRSGAHNDTRYSPEYFVQWALRKGFPIPWLEYAQKEGYFGEPEAAEVALNDVPIKVEKALNTTERNSLLRIIAALCDYSDIKHQGRGVAVQIAKMTDEIGASVGDDTIRDVLAKIPNALVARTK